MPKVDLKQIPIKTGSTYPGKLSELMQGRSSQAVGQLSGLTQFGANLVRLDPGAISSLRHWHENQDEIAVVTEGEIALIDDDGEHTLVVGECAAWPAGDANGHHLMNKSNAPAAFLVIGTHTEVEFAHYSDIDMKVRIDATGAHFTHNDGTPHQGETK